MLFRPRVKLMSSSLKRANGQAGCRFSLALLGLGSVKLAETCNSKITGVEAAQVTDRLNKQAASSAKAPLDRSAGSR